MSSAFGRLFRIISFGESHGPATGVVIDGCPPNLALDPAEVQRELDRRRPGQSRLVTQRAELDEIQILSGLYEGKTTGTPIAMLVINKDQQPGAYDHLKDLYRPSHADFTYQAKYGIRDHRGGGRASARETVGRVAAGTVARKVLAVAAGVEILSWVSQIGEVETDLDHSKVTMDEIEATPVRCPDPEAAALMTAAIEEAKKNGDSLGGVITLLCRNMPIGLGDPVFGRLDADLAAAMISIPASKGFEVGSGFAGTKMTGRSHNDPFVEGDSPDRPKTKSNHSGGIQGGISNGADIICRIAFKPTATIALEQNTVTTEGQAVNFKARGRHDPCVLPRAVPIVDAMAALVLADHWLQQRVIESWNE